MNRLVVVSNRVPRPDQGAQAGGLAVALDGLMERRGGLWFGWSGDMSPTATQTPIRLESAGAIDFATLDLTPDEHARYYNNFSNGVLWPLLHTLPELMRYDRADARVYRGVNARMAAALVPLLRPTDLIWVHDYHLLALPAALRSRGVANPIGFFLHIPFASSDVLGAASEVASLVRDLLSADLLGFQTDNDLHNFVSAAQSFAGAEVLDDKLLKFGTRRVRLGVFPVEIDSRRFAQTATEMATSGPAIRLRHSLDPETLLLGIDRLDPTKGLPQRLAGYRRLLEKHPQWHGRATLVQIAATSRKEVGSYQSLRATLDAEAGRLNADLGEPDWQPLRLVTRACSREVGAAYMRAARVGLVTPLRDGMNLVAKEFVAAQDPEDPGVLVLSRFAGAAQQLDAALLVNPHDSDMVADSLHTALTMGLAERKSRWQALWSRIEDRTPIAWGRGFVAALHRTASIATVAGAVGSRSGLNNVHQLAPSRPAAPSEDDDAAEVARDG